jgi:hypothetical protein
MKEQNSDAYVLLYFLGLNLATYYYLARDKLCSLAMCRGRVTRLRVEINLDVSERPGRLKIGLWEAL